MNFIPVKSSAIQAVAYDVEDKTLTVRFKQGAEYDYYDVPKEKFEGLLKAESVGKYFNKYIRL